MGKQKATEDTTKTVVHGSAKRKGRRDGLGVVHKHTGHPAPHEYRKGILATTSWASEDPMTLREKRNKR